MSVKKQLQPEALALRDNIDIAVTAFEKAFRVARAAADRDRRPGVRRTASALATNLAVVHDRVSHLKRMGLTLTREMTEDETATAA